MTDVTDHAQQQIIAFLSFLSYKYIPFIEAEVSFYFSVLQLRLFFFFSLQFFLDGWTFVGVGVIELVRIARRPRYFA